MRPQHRERETLEVSQLVLDGRRKFYGEDFPRALECRDDGATLDAVRDWAERQAARLIGGLSACGVILFRGFPLSTAEDFDAFVAAFGLENFPYRKSLSNAVRINRTERVFTANEAPSEVAIYLHHEMAQTPFYPSKLFFFCRKPAAGGGATPVCRSDVLLDRLAKEFPAFVHDCETKGLRYTNVMPPENDRGSGMGRSWRSTLDADTRVDAERRLAELDYSWEWLEDGCLRVTTPVLPAVRELESGRRAFFNQLIAAFKGWTDSRNDPARSITYGDGTPLDRQSAVAAAEFADEATVDLDWRQGDVALVDNFTVLHGRRPFEGTREVLASLVV